MTKKELEKQNRELLAEVREHKDDAERNKMRAETKQLSLSANINQLHATEEALTHALDLVEFLRPPKKRDTVAYAFEANVANHETPSKKRRS